MEQHEDQSVSLDGDHEDSFHCSFLDALPVPVKRVLAWHSPVVSGAILFAAVAAALAIKLLSFVSVVAYAGLAVVSLSLLARLYVSFHAPMQHPLAPLLERDTRACLAAASALLERQLSSPHSRLNALLAALSSLLLLSDYALALRFLLACLALLLVGSVFNLADLALLAAVLALTAPRAYRSHRAAIDSLAARARRAASSALDTIRLRLAAVPVLGPLAAPPKDKQL